MGDDGVMDMALGTNHAFDFDAPPAPPPAKPVAPAPAPLAPAASAPLRSSEAAAGTELAWVAERAASANSKRQIEQNWTTLCGEAWRDYLAQARAARAAGVPADTAVAQIAEGSGRHHPATIAGLCRGAGLVRTSDERRALLAAHGPRRAP